MAQRIPITDGNFKIVYADGSSVDMARHLSVLVVSFDTGAPNPRIEYDGAAGRSGDLRMGKTWGSRQLKAVCELFAEDHYDYAALKDEIVTALYREDEYYLINENSPGKRWKVEVSGAFSPSRIGISGTFEIPFVCADGYAESIVRTSENEFRFDSTKLQFGQGIVTEPLVYRFTTNTFRVYNAGSVAVDWRGKDALLSYLGASNNLRIRNVTTGADWRYTGASNSGDTIRLIDRARSTKNQLSIFGATNMAAMVLAPGWNEFQITGSSGSFEVTFDFRFLYL